MVLLNRKAILNKDVFAKESYKKTKLYSSRENIRTHTHTLHLRVHTHTHTHAREGTNHLPASDRSFIPLGIPPHPQTVGCPTFLVRLLYPSNLQHYLYFGC